MIKEIEDQDLEQVRRLYLRTRQATFPDAEGLCLADYDRDTAGELVLVAHVQESIAGFVSAWEPGRFVHNLFVGLSFQGLGIGSALLDEVALRLGFPLTLKCVATNQPALDYYRHRGWVVAEKIANVPEPHFLLRLDAAESPTD